MRQIQFFSTTNDIYLFLGFSSKKGLIFLSYDIDLIIGKSPNSKEGEGSFAGIENSSLAILLRKDGSNCQN